MMAMAMAAKRSNFLALALCIFRCLFPCLWLCAAYFSYNESDKIISVQIAARALPRYTVPRQVYVTYTLSLPHLRLLHHACEMADSQAPLPIPLIPLLPEVLEHMILGRLPVLMHLGSIISLGTDVVIEAFFARPDVVIGIGSEVLVTFVRRRGRRGGAYPAEM